MKLTRVDVILLIIVIAISMIFYVFVGDQLSNGYSALIILIFGLTVGVSKRLFFDGKTK